MVVLVNQDLMENLELQDKQVQLGIRDPGVHQEEKGSPDPKENKDHREQLGPREILDHLELLDFQLVHTKTSLQSMPPICVLTLDGSSRMYCITVLHRGMKARQDLLDNLVLKEEV